MGAPVDTYAELFISFSSFQKCYCSLTPWDAMKCRLEQELIGARKVRKVLCNVRRTKIHVFSSLQMLTHPVTEPHPYSPAHETFFFTSSQTLGFS